MGSGVWQVGSYVYNSAVGIEEVFEDTPIKQSSPGGWSCKRRF
jgi:hypothetical protein